MEPPPRLTAPGYAIASWAAAGVLAIIGFAIARLGARALYPLTEGNFTATRVAFLGVWIPAMLYFEGYRGFQRGFAPRVVVRALWLARHGRPWHVALGPAFCMGLIHATRRRLLSAWILLASMIALVRAVRMLDPAWRGLVDIGVVLGLIYGEAAIAFFFIRAMRGTPPLSAPDVPEGDPS